ncbi:MAG: hypothetical protein EHM81_08110, partial [Chloroflexi bacterium]
EPRAEKTNCAPTHYTANQLKGFDVETAKEIARRMGVEACFVAPAWAQIIAGNWENNWDVDIGSMTITYGRMEALYFTQPYYATPVVFFVHKENATYTRPEDLSGKRIGVCAGCTFENYLNRTLKLPGVELKFVVENPQIIAFENNEEPAIRALSEGDGVNLEAVLTQLPVGMGAIKNGAQIKPIGDPVYYAYAAVAVDKKVNRDPISLVRRITAIIQEMHRDGTLGRLSLEYQGMDLAAEAGNFDFNLLGQIP